MSRRLRRRLRRMVKGGVALAAGSLAVPLARLLNTAARDDLELAIGQMLMIGFYGNTARSFSARLLAAQVRAKRVGGVFFVLQNVGSREEVEALVRLFRAGGPNPLLAIDHEGGIVQRLTAAHGCTPLPCARDVAATMTPQQAMGLYAQAGRELSRFGFNVNLGPVVDIDVPDNPAIGRFGRSFGGVPERIAAYASAFLDGFAQAGVLCAVKHFPGHGHAREDSHDGAADISGLWSEAELEPFARLIAEGRPMMVMGGHLRLRALEPDGSPVTLSRDVITGILRERLGFSGVMMTDDLDMGAVSAVMTRREAVIRAIAAGNDILLIRNVFGYDAFLPRRIVAWVRSAIADGTLSETQVLEAARRIQRARRRPGR